MRRPLVVALVVMVAAVAGCSSSGSSDTTSDTTSDTSSDTTSDTTSATIEAATTTMPGPGESEASTNPASARTHLRPVLQCVIQTSQNTIPPKLTSDPTQTEVLQAVRGEVCAVGPAAGDGSVFEQGSAAALVIAGSWGVIVRLQPGARGDGIWNALAASCFAGDETCPTRRLAIEVDGIIESAPSVNAPTFDGSVQISGSFTKAEADALAAILNDGGS